MKIMNNLFLVSCCIIVSCSSKPNEIPDDCMTKVLAIKHVPMKITYADDPNYLFFKTNSDNEKIRDCLIKNITNETKMVDPKSLPHNNKFRAGDLALNLLSDFYGLDLLSAYPKNVQIEYVDMGAYAFISYVNNNENARAIIQKRVKSFYGVN